MLFCRYCERNSNETGLDSDQAVAVPEAVSLYPPGAS